MGRSAGATYYESVALPTELRQRTLERSAPKLKTKGPKGKAEARRRSGPEDFQTTCDFPQFPAVSGGRRGGIWQEALPLSNVVFIGLAPPSHLGPSTGLCGHDAGISDRTADRVAETATTPTHRTPSPTTCMLKSGYVCSIHVRVRSRPAAPTPADVRIRCLLAASSPRRREPHPGAFEPDVSAPAAWGPRGYPLPPRRPLCRPPPGDRSGRT